METLTIGDASLQRDIVEIVPPQSAKSRGGDSDEVERMVALDANPYKELGCFGLPPSNVTWRQFAICSPLMSIDMGRRSSKARCDEMPALQAKAVAFETPHSLLIAVYFECLRRARHRLFATISPAPQGLTITLDSALGSSSDAPLRARSDKPIEYMNDVMKTPGDALISLESATVFDYRRAPRSLFFRRFRICDNAMPFPAHSRETR